MPRLSKIYTRTGDDGTTGLGTGERVSKTDARVEAYGTVDEANAALGLAIVACEQDAAHAAMTERDPEGPTSRRLREIVRTLQLCQHDLFDVGGDLCIPVKAGEQGMLRVQAEQTARLESAIDRFNEPLAPLKNFILPGGTPGAAALHLARTVARRAERLCVALFEGERETVNPETVRYLNRLSDLLFVLCRVANGNGAQDVLWQPGSTRGKA